MLAYGSVGCSYMAAIFADGRPDALADRLRVHLRSSRSKIAKAKTKRAAAAKRVKAVC